MAEEVTHHLTTEGDTDEEKMMSVVESQGDCDIKSLMDDLPEVSKGDTEEDKMISVAESQDEEKSLNNHPEVSAINLCAEGKHGCEHIFVPPPGVFICNCKKGLKLNMDGRTCTNMDMSNKAVHCPVHCCVHKCVNTPGPYYCNCLEGKLLHEDGKSCSMDDSDEKKTIFVSQTRNESQDVYKNIPSKEDEPTVSEGDAEEKKIVCVHEAFPGSQGDSVKSTAAAASFLIGVSASEVKAEEVKEIPPQETADTREESEGIISKDTADNGSDEMKNALTEVDNIQHLQSNLLPQIDFRSLGDDKKTFLKKDLDNSGEDQSGLYKTPEETIILTQVEKKEKLGDKLHKDSPESGGIEDIVVKTDEDLEIQTTKQDKEVKPRDDVATVGAISRETTVPSVLDWAESLGGGRNILVAMVAVLVVAYFVQQIQPQSTPQVSIMSPAEIFRKLMDEVKTQFPHQRDELWFRSGIHLQRHLQTDQPTEPVSVILTAGLRAQRTLHCLAQGLAFAFSSALNASVLLIDGASVASQDSDQVKLDIDSQLQGAFEGNTPVAVIHRFEELPPGSTLIFYRYCDHENAAYKKTFLIFTVLLEEEEEIPAKIHLSAVEEMVDDHLQKKFLSLDQPVSFDRMDRDKYGGLWSRISHLILPVASEDKIELEGCERT